MKTRRQKPKDQAVKSTAAPVTTTTWSGGPVWASRGATVALCSLVLTGPLALGGVALLSLEPADAGPVIQEQVDLTAASAAQEAGRELVEAWLSSTRDDASALERVYPDGAVSLPETAWAVRSVAVSSLTEVGDGAWSVVVAADVAEPTAGEDEAEATEEWRRRYFQVPVVVAETGVGMGARATALPAPVAGPALPEVSASEFTADLSSDAALTETVAGFLSSLLAGQGDIERYLSPGAVVAPVDPPAFVEVAVNALDANTSDHEPSTTPADEQQLSVLVAATLTRVDGQKTTAEYVLDLEARAGRWEITQISTETTQRPDGTSSTEGDL